MDVRDELTETQSKREALRWLARSLAWEARLSQLRGGDSGRPVVERPLAA
jgi:hypothetical protein